MALVSQAVEAAKSGFVNGDIKMFTFELLSVGYQSFLCSNHLRGWDGQRMACMPKQPTTAKPNRR